MKFGKFFSFLWILTLMIAAQAQAEAPSEIEIIFDASGSMNDAMGGTTKLDAAKQVMTTIAGQIQEGASVGLRMFGVTPVRDNIKESCSDSVLAFPVGPFQKQSMVDKVQPIKSYGMTAIGLSLQKAGEDFSKNPNSKKTVILISDGEETCGQDPLAVVAALKAQGIEFAIHAIGFDASDKGKEQMGQLAQQTGGSYHEAKDAAELQKSLEEVAQQAKLLKPQSKEAGENLISAQSGAVIVDASEPALAELVDGSDKVASVTFSDGAHFAVAFKDKQPALVESVAVPIFEENPENMSKITVLGSVEKPDANYFVIKEASLENKVNFDNVYQLIKLDTPMPLRFIKFYIGPSFKGGGVYKSYGYEIKAYGKLLSEEEFKNELSKIKIPDTNILAKENGGKMIASTNERFSSAIDGQDGRVGSWGGVNAGEEAVFGFAKDGVYQVKGVAVGVTQPGDGNCRHFDVEVSESSPTGPYTKVGTYEISKMVFAGNVFQNFPFEKPAKAKFVKIKIVDQYGPSYNYCQLEEIQAFGDSI